MLRPWQRLFASQKPRPRPVVTQRPVCSALGPLRWAASADARARPAGCRRPRGGAAAGAGQPAWWHFVTVQSRPRPAVATTAPLSLLSGTQGRRGPGRPGACSSGPTHVAPVTLSSRNGCSLPRLSIPQTVRAGASQARHGRPRPVAEPQPSCGQPSSKHVSPPALRCFLRSRRARPGAGGVAACPRGGTRGSYRPSDPRVSVLQGSKKHKMEENA